MALSHPSSPPASVGSDLESSLWLSRLSSSGPERDRAVGELRELLLGAARFEINRRRHASGHPRNGDHEDLAQQSADDALMAILAKLGDFRGESRFTTWAYKFALLEAGVKSRRRAWQGREIPLDAERWDVFLDPRAQPHTHAETNELTRAIREAIATELTPRQREVLVALALNDVPIDVLAERLRSSRGALYKTLHDARRKLRLHLDRQGLSIGAPTRKGESK